MTRLLKKVFAEASKLPAGEQDALARWLMEELASEREWERLVSSSVEPLGRLADEALAEHRRGATRELDPDKM